MADFINGLFSSAPGIRRVNPLGLIVMLIGVIVTVSANKLAELIFKDKQDRGFFAIKLASILICVAGFIIAVI